jgi:lipoyl(octanoyl) transferase
MKVNDLGTTHYNQALDEQVAARASREVTGVVCFEPSPVVTLGLRAASLSRSPFEILRVDRGGEVTYHGPGQILFFPVVHLPTWKISVREFVSLILTVTSECLEEWGISSNWDLSKPGVYTARGKIASVGLKIQSGWSRHGLALNVNGDLTPFSQIMACGVEGAAMDKVTSWKDISREQAIGLWSSKFEQALRQ